MQSRQRKCECDANCFFAAWVASLAAAEADGGIQEKEHGACIPIEKFRTCIGSADSCAEDVHRGNGEFAANNEMELPVSRKYAEQAMTADNRAKNGGGNL